MKERHGSHDKEIEKLTAFMGENITCIYYENGKLKGYKGILNEVYPYDSIVVEGKKIEFLGYEVAIKYILYEDKIILYRDTIENYKGISINKEHLKELQYKYLGYSIIDEKQHKVLQK